MPSIFFIEQTDGPGVRSEIVKDLRERAAKHEAAAKAAGDKAAKARDTELGKARALREAAEHWEGALLGNPLKAGAGPVSAPKAA